MSSSHSAGIRSWTDQEGRSSAPQPSSGRALWSCCTASCGLARLRRAATRLFLWLSPPQANGGAGAYINQPQILVGDLLCPHDVRCDREDNLAFVPFFTLLAKQVLQEGNFCQPRITAQ